MNIKCQVIEDLIPLYIDGVCSEESKELIEEHLKECSKCNNKYKVQKSDIFVDDKIIKENLKSKEPFKKIKRYQIIRTIVILIMIPILYLSVVEIGGDGVGFSALYGRYKVERFLSYVEKGEFISATNYINFEGGIYQSYEKKDDAIEKWIDGMNNLKKEGIEFVSHKDNNIKTDDGFTAGYVTITVKYQDRTYNFRMFTSTNNGKVEPGLLHSEVYYEATEPSNVEEMLADKITKVINTYNPG